MRLLDKVLGGLGFLLMMYGIGGLDDTDHMVLAAVIALSGLIMIYISSLNFMEDEDFEGVGYTCNTMQTNRFRKDTNRAIAKDRIGLWRGFRLHKRTSDNKRCRISVVALTRRITKKITRK